MLDVPRIPDRIGYYFAGFVDGEGSFHLSFRRRRDYKLPWKVSLCLNVSQKDKVVLALFKRHLKCGTIRYKSDDVWMFEVNNLNAIRENVIPFFRRFGFLSAKKKRDFAIFRQMAELMNDKVMVTIRNVGTRIEGKTAAEIQAMVEERLR